MASVKTKLLVFIFCVWSLSLSILLIVNSPFIYKMVIEYFHIQETYHLKMGLIDYNFENTVQYLQSPFINKMDNLIKMDKLSRIHFAEVKKFIIINNIIFIFSTLSISKIFRKLKRSSQLWTLKYTLQRIATISTFGFVWCMLDFNDAFVLFHSLLFNNQYWLLNNKTSPIIEVYPFQYFMVCAIILYINFMILIIVLIILGNKEIK